MNLIALDTIPDGIASSYGPGGATRQRVGGRVTPWRYEDLTSCAALGRRTNSVWKLSRGTARDLVALNDDMRAAGSPGLRLTEGWRPFGVSEAEHEKWLAWRAAGSPDPDSTQFVKGRMRTAYVAPAGRSFHNSGLAIDIDVELLGFPGLSGDDALGVFWDLAAARGFTPIIVAPKSGQSESWHFDHLGPLTRVVEAFVAHRKESRVYADPYGLTAWVGCILSGQVIGPKALERYLQARLLLAGFWAGVPDGVIGPKTLAALATAGVSMPRGTPASVLIGKLDELEIGVADLAAA